MHADATDWTRVLHRDLLATPQQRAQGRSRPPQRNVLSALTRVWQGVASMTARIRSAHAQRRRARAMRAELAALDARALQDIGLHRDEIPSMVAELTLEARPTRMHTLRALGNAYASRAMDCASS